VQKPVAIALVGAVVALGIARLHATNTGNMTAAPPTVSSTSTPVAPDVATTAAPNPDAVMTTARTWVAALWARRPGDGPSSWLDRVAAIIAPALLAELRGGRATPGESTLLQSTVVISGVYPDATDPATVTVVGVAHQLTASGQQAVPFATAVTVAGAADGHTQVVALR
jgi:hypothetical protein